MGADVVTAVYLLLAVALGLLLLLAVALPNLRRTDRSRRGTSRTRRPDERDGGASRPEL